ncbi:hypothetical protein [Bradyrhizobium sp. F1.13.3]|uniref:hypothetical protein n=1 Tax=Bradyrhizobium sp. F1.13.3 TaxID=3156351 RepID=UPI003395F53C
MTASELHVQYSKNSEESARSSDNAELLADLDVSDAGEDIAEVITAIQALKVVETRRAPEPTPPQPAAPKAPPPAAPRARYSDSGMAGVSDEQLERFISVGSTVPDGCQSGRFATCGGCEGAYDRAVGEMLAELDAVDDEAPPSAAETARINRRKELRDRLSLTIEEMAEAAKLPPKPSLKEQIRAERAARKRAKIRRQSADRSRRYRARKRDESPSLPVKRSTRWAVRRLNALLRATANPRGDKRLIKLRGRETEIVQFIELRRALGKQATHRKIAEFITKSEQAARRLARVVKELEQPGQCWFGME